MKTIYIKWKDGSITSMAVHSDTDVLTAYKPVLAHIKKLIELYHETDKIKVLHEESEI